MSASEKQKASGLIKFKRIIPSTEGRVVRKKLNAFVRLCQGQKNIV
jgi:hypothetical protein